MVFFIEREKKRQMLSRNIYSSTTKDIQQKMLTQRHMLKLSYFERNRDKNHTNNEITLSILTWMKSFLETHRNDSFMIIFGFTESLQNYLLAFFIALNLM